MSPRHRKSQCMNSTLAKRFIHLRLSAFLGLSVGLTAVSAANLPCADWETQLVEQVSKANSCDVKLKACIDKEFGNPMRELNYCQHVNKNCQSLDARLENAPFAQELAEFKKSCVKD